MNPSGHPTISMKPPLEGEATRPIACPACNKPIVGEPNFCPACGGDLRGIDGNSDTYSGGLRDKLIDGRYRLIEKLGEGGMGSVFKVEHVRMGKIAALKLMRPDSAVDKSLKARFLQEARVVARLSHANTVQVFDTGELEDGALFIAMEFVAGKDLAWHLKTNGPLSEAKIVAVAIQILASLQEAHEAGVVHRDIKPANVMLVRTRKGDDRVKLLDFGIAKLQEAESRNSTTGDFVGTPAYMSPEQIRGEGVDHRSDLYSLGAMMFELVTGRQLFVGASPISIITQHTEGNVPRVSEVAPNAAVSPGFEMVMRRALSKALADRYADAEAMKSALEGLTMAINMSTGGGEMTPMPAELAEKMLSREEFEGYERKMRLQRTLAPIITLAVILAVLIGGIHFVMNRPSATMVTEEIEPNDAPSQATSIPLNADVHGTIGAAPTDQNDRDLFVVDVPEGLVRVSLEGVPDLNLTAEILQLEKQSADSEKPGEKTGEKLKRRVFLDDVGPGGSERVDALQVSAGPLYIRIEEKPFVTESNRPSREKSLVPYTLRVEAMNGAGPYELEPNDTPGTAQPLPMTRAITAFAGARTEEPEKLAALRPNAPFSSSDWFRIEAGPDEVMYLIVVPPERGALQVVDGAALEIWRQKKAAATSRSIALPVPAGVIVKGEPALIELKAIPGTTSRRARITTAEDTLPGASYRVALASTTENGLAGLLDLTRTLTEANQEVSKQALLVQARKALEKSPDVSRLKSE